MRHRLRISGETDTRPSYNDIGDRTSIMKLLSSTETLEHMKQRPTTRYSSGPSPYSPLHHPPPGHRSLEYRLIESFPASAPSKVRCFSERSSCFDSTSSVNLSSMERILCLATVHICAPSSGPAADQYDATCAMLTAVSHDVHLPETLLSLL